MCFGQTLNSLEHSVNSWLCERPYACCPLCLKCSSHLCKPEALNSSNPAGRSPLPRSSPWSSELKIIRVIAHHLCWLHCASRSMTMLYLLPNPGCSQRIWHITVLKNIWTNACFKSSWQLTKSNCFVNFVFRCSWLLRISLNDSILLHWHHSCGCANFRALDRRQPLPWAGLR